METRQICVRRKPWTLAFAAEPEELAALRRITGLHLRCWGLHHLVDAAQLCVTELVTNVIGHVGPGTPAELSLGMRGTAVRIEVQDPDLRALPTLLRAADDAEGGRGMAIVAATARRWGVLIQDDRKVTWCELATGLGRPGGHIDDDRVNRAEALLALYCEAEALRTAGPRAASGSQGPDITREATVGALIADLLRWARAHGYDADDVLSSAEARIYGE
ncbi:ATP-binding protein [Streptomyces sp. SID5785]|uniref:ATP-binding protein n=1 Tax=Streptomyces sp. SID5785 TaxID=2690309 RepID=UPI001361A15E|nr:ATP-binding protein [Streptomyces sp. SID5785]MZD05780.1 ATP-binding protein [Streptomyces sp. SID5785]